MKNRGIGLAVLLLIVPGSASSELPRCGDNRTTCLDAALVGAWVKIDHRGKQLLFQNGPPFVIGWVIRPNGDVYPLAINFDTGTLAEGPRMRDEFYGITYGCNGSLYQRTSMVGAAIACGGKYRKDGKRLSIVDGAYGSSGVYVPVEIGEKVVDPIHFLFDMTLNRSPIPVPRTASRIPASAYLREWEGSKRMSMSVSAGSYEIRIHIPNVPGAGKLVGESAGSVNIERPVNDHIVMNYNTRGADQASLNEMDVIAIDPARGRVQGRFRYQVWNQGNPYQLAGRFDIPLYTRMPIPDPKPVSGTRR